MAELQLGGKIIATQLGANNPVLASNVVMDNVNVSNALASATFPVGHIIEVKTINHTSSSGDTFGLAFGTALTMSNILTTEKVIIICGGGWAKFATGTYKRRSRTHVQVDYDGTTALIKGGYAANQGSWADESGASGFCIGIWENNTSSNINVLSLKSYVQGDSGANAYGNWDASADYPITIVAMRCVNA